MSMALESEAFFASRAKSVGLSDAHVQLLKTAGVATMASLTFFCTYQPGGADDAALKDAVKDALTVDLVPGPVMIAMRRLHYEAHAMYISDLKNKVTATDEDAPKRVPVQERAARHEEQKVRLNGLRLEGELECSYALLDLVMQQFERNELRYITLNLCTSREQEQAGFKKDAILTLDSEGQLRIKPSSISAKVDTSTDFRIFQAFNRRGLAYDQAQLITYSTHSKWVDFLFSSMQRKPPEGFLPVSFQQVMTADKELWKKLTDETRAGIVPDAGGVKPLDAAMNKWTTSPEILFFLMPMQGRQSQPSAPEGKGNPFGKTFEKWNGKGSDIRYSPKGAKGGKSSGKGPKGKQRTEFPRMPEGCVTKTSKGQRICIQFNNSLGCKHAKPGQSCDRGLHICAKPECGGNHSAVGCTA
jgi:hypothetical protein